MKKKTVYKGIVCVLIPFLLLSSCKSGEEEEDDQKQKESYSVQLSATVKDLSAPVIKCEDELYRKIGDDLDWKKLIKVEDNVDVSPIYEIKGNVDMDHSGTYPITIIAKDDSGNVRRKKLTVYVSEGSRPIAEKDRKEETPQASVPDTKSKEQAPPSSASIQSRYFAFRERISRDATYQECMSYIATSLAGKSGTGNCIVVDDANGVHIGYQASFN